MSDRRSSHFTTTSDFAEKALSSPNIPFETPANFSSGTMEDSDLCSRKAPGIN